MLTESHNDCEIYEETTSAEQDNDDDGFFVCGKRSCNRRLFEDHVASSEGKFTKYLLVTMPAKQTSLLYSFYILVVAFIKWYVLQPFTVLE
jgi:hypothetical protein